MRTWRCFILFSHAPKGQRTNQQHMEFMNFFFFLSWIDQYLRQQEKPPKPERYQQNETMVQAFLPVLFFLSYLCLCHVLLSTSCLSLSSSCELLRLVSCSWFLLCVFSTVRLVSLSGGPVISGFTVWVLLQPSCLYSLCLDIRLGLLPQLLLPACLNLEFSLIKAHLLLFVRCLCTMCTNYLYSSDTTEVFLLCWKAATYLMMFFVFFLCQLLASTMMWWGLSLKNHFKTHLHTKQHTSFYSLSSRYNPHPDNP